MNQIVPTPGLAEPFHERRGVPASPPVQIAHIVAVAGSNAVGVLEKSAQGTIATKDPRVQIDWMQRG